MLEGALLAVHVADALVHIPIAVSETRNLLQRKEHAKASASFEQLVQDLRDLSKLGKWFQEAKDLHHNLQKLDTQLESFRWIDKASRQHGRFDEQVYYVPNINADWDKTKDICLGYLIQLTAHIQYVEPAPLVLRNDGTAQSGPDWARKFANCRAEIDELLALYHKNDRAFTVTKLKDAINALIHHTKKTMDDLDVRLKNESAAFAEKLAIMGAALGR